MRNNEFAVAESDRFVGREAEQEQLRLVIADSLAGSIAAAVVTGPPGSGVTELLRRAGSFYKPRVEVVRLGTGDGAIRPSDIDLLDAQVMDLARPHPTLVLIDDVDRFDPGTDRRLAELVCRWRDASDRHGLVTAIIAGSILRGDPAAQGGTEVIAALYRELPTRQVQLGGLSPLEAFECVHQVLGGRPSPALVDEVIELTEARPGAIRTLLHHARRADALVAGTDGWLRTVPLATFDARHEMPRLDLGPIEGLNQPTRELVEALACLGVSGPVALVPVEDTDADQRLDELCERRLIDEDGQRFWFLDRDLPTAILGTVSTRRRQRHHAAIVMAALARGALDCGEHEPPDSAADQSVLLFHQARLAGPKLAPSDFAHVARRAAVMSERRRDWATATLALESLLGVNLAPCTDRLDLLMRCANAHYWHLANERSVEYYDRAAALADDLGHPERVAEARVRSLYVRVYAGLPLPTWAPTIDDPPSVQAWFHLLDSDRLFALGRNDEGLERCRRAAELAQVSGLAEIEARAALATGLQYLLRLDLDHAAASFQEAAKHAAQCDDPLVAHWPTSRIALTEWLGGQSTGALARARRSALHADAARWWSESSLSWAAVALGAFSSGDLTGAIDHATRCRRLVMRSGFQFALPIAMPVWVAATTFRGDERGALSALEGWGTLEQVPELVTLVTRAMFGHETRRPTRLQYDAVDLMRSGRTVLAVELADWTQDAELAAVNLPPLVNLVERGVTGVIGWPVAVARTASLAAWWAGEHERALLLNTVAIAAADRGGDVVNAALAAFDAARWSPDGEAGTRQLAAVVSRLDRLGLSTWAARAQRELDDRPFASELAGSHATRILLYTDLVDSTSINVRVGDQRFLRLVAEHQLIVDQCAGDWRGSRFHNSGDGFGLWFADVDDALTCALLLHRRFAEATARHPDTPLTARIGVAAGQPVPFDGDLYGTAVVRAARICSQSTGGAVLVSDEVIELNPNGRFRFSLAGLQTLKGFERQTTMYRLLDPHQSSASPPTMSANQHRK